MSSKEEEYIDEINEFFKNPEVTLECEMVTLNMEVILHMCGYYYDRN